MKLLDILYVHEAEAFAADFAPNARKRLPDTHFELAYNAVRKETLTMQDIKELAKDMPENEVFDRTVGAARFILARMHILVHGVAPYGVTEKSAEDFFKSDPGSPMNRFVETKGIDVDMNVKNAKVEMKTRLKKRKEPDALGELSAYYQANRDIMPPNIYDHKEEIKNALMAGHSPEEAFAPFVI